MQLSTTIFIALGLSADAFAVAITSGFIIKHIKINKALKIALFFGFFQGIMPFIGWGTGLVFRDFVSGIDHWIAFTLLSCIGGKMIYQSLDSDADDQKFNPLDFYTLLGLAIATSIDALAMGLGFSLLKTSILEACTLIGLITFILSFIGVFIGHIFGGLFNKKIEIIGGLILILMGGQILFEGF